jgi:hypothetical protein
MEILSDLYLVGKTKAVGYLPLRTLLQCGVSVQMVQNWTQKSGFVCCSFSQSFSRTYSGSVWVYDPLMLGLFLVIHKEALEVAIPSIPISVRRAHCPAHSLSGSKRVSVSNNRLEFQLLSLSAFPIPD